LSETPGMIEIKFQATHVEAAMAGFSDAGSTPAVSTIKALSGLMGLFFGAKEIFHVQQQVCCLQWLENRLYFNKFFKGKVVL
jgi:hypothetical protein